MRFTANGNPPTNNNPQSAVKWLLDGKETGANEIIPSKGKHKLVAKISLGEGKLEVIEHEFEAK